MVNKKRQKFEHLVEKEELKNLPLAFRFLIKRPTNIIGEMYSQVRFSSSSKLQTKSLNNYLDFTPISSIFISKEK
jgi:hypothetical protein